ncbi:MAG: transposase [Deltaproteobacteria bacterium]|nr:transposase [Deltaproteobacteria bacterium]
MTLLEVTKKLNTHKRCLKFIEQTRWPHGITCPRCEGEKIINVGTRDKYECSECRYQFNATAGTVLSKTYIPLPKWMVAIYLFCAHSGQTRAAELVRVLDLPYKTAWHLLNRIRRDGKNHDFDKLAGLV